MWFPNSGTQLRFVLVVNRSLDMTDKSFEFTKL